MLDMVSFAMTETMECKDCSAYTVIVTVNLLMQI